MHSLRALAELIITPVLQRYFPVLPVPVTSLFLPDCPP
ncbi:hypothetical protein [Morganella morganii IS15]|nr:hypothetical protein CSB69_1309 [Morganella morganii]EMP50736.1 hypothetical protein C790_02116 [Morganella morganii SC01]CDK67396.1 hypothetical protein [Morganella morganii IS15]